MNIKTFSIHAVRNIFAFFIALGLGYVAYTVNPSSVEIPKAEAAPTSLSGYAWSDTIGYISFSCTTCGLGNYAVNVDPTTGNFSGIAWSSDIDTAPNPDQGGIGWISFDRAVTGNPPAAPYQTGVSSDPIAKTDSLGNVTGWARALSACTNNYWDSVNKKCTNTGAGDASGGWDGWIKLSDTWTNPVKINPSDGKFSGYAWGGAQVDASGNSIPGGVSVIGWINFAGTAQDSSTYLVQGPVLVSSCTSNLDCTGGKLCNITTGVCVVPNDPCGPSSSCGIGQLCNGSNLCVYSDGFCSTNADCVGGQVCNASGKCVEPVGGYCNTSPDCFNGQICNTTTHACYDKPKTKFWQF